MNFRDGSVSCRAVTASCRVLLFYPFAHLSDRHGIGQYSRLHQTCLLIITTTIVRLTCACL